MTSRTLFLHVKRDIGQPTGFIQRLAEIDNLFDSLQTPLSQIHDRSAQKYVKHINHRAKEIKRIRNSLPRGGRA
jgi:hypothetical protein